MYNLSFRGKIIGTYESVVGGSSVNAYATFIANDEGKKLGLKDSDMISIFPTKIKLFTHNAEIKKTIIKFEPESK